MTMVERVAKAIEDAHDDGAWGCYERIGHTVALECARAAIEAMLEATDAMAFAGADALAMEMQAPSATLMALGYGAMIEAALRDAS